MLIRSDVNLMEMQANITHGVALDQKILEDLGLSIPIIRSAVEHSHEILDQIDKTLDESGAGQFSDLVELANLSAIVGNIFRSGVVRASEGRFESNTPHTFPDILAVAQECSDIEIKVALETNHPKGHLVKPGAHLTVRYVLADEQGKYQRGKEHRGKVVWIWEVRVGFLEELDFNISNTEGDSGKTAVINSAGLDKLLPVFVDLEKCPYVPNGLVIRKLKRILKCTDLVMSGHIRRKEIAN